MEFDYATMRLGLETIHADKKEIENTLRQETKAYIFLWKHVSKLKKGFANHLQGR